MPRIEPRSGRTSRSRCAGDRTLSPCRASRARGAARAPTETKVGADDEDVVPDHPEVRQAAAEVSDASRDVDDRGRRPRRGAPRSRGRSPSDRRGSRASSSGQRPASAESSGTRRGDPRSPATRSPPTRTPATAAGRTAARPGRLGAEDRPAQDQAPPARRRAASRNFGTSAGSCWPSASSCTTCENARSAARAVSVPEGGAPPAIHGQTMRPRPRAAGALALRRLLRRLVAPVVDDQARQPEMGQRVEHAPIVSLWL